MEQRHSPRYGLTIETGKMRSALNRSRPSSAYSNRSGNDEIQNAADMIDQFKSSSPRSLASPKNSKSSQQKRDDINIEIGPGTNSRVDSSSPGNQVEAIETTYIPKFFNYEPAAPSPRYSAKTKSSPVVEAASKQSNKVASSATPKTQAKTRVSNSATSMFKSLQKHTNHPSTPKSSPRNAKQRTPIESPSLSESTNDIILPSNSSASFNTTSQLQKIMRTPEELALRTKKKPNKRQIPLNVVCNEEGFEVQGFSVAEHGKVYNMKGNVKWGLEGAQNPNSDVVAKKESLDGESDTSELGKNGWHRVIDAWKPQDEEKKPTSLSPEATATLDQLSDIHILQHSLAAYDEYDALCEERSCLLQEIRALEKDRLCLEKMFHEIQKEMDEEDLHNDRNGSRSKHVLSWEYKDFKENITRIERDDRKYLPQMWVEELAVMEDALLDDGVGAKRSGNKKAKRKTHSDDKFSKDMADKIRHDRGDSLALLLSDVNAKNSLIGRCYMNSIGKGRNNRVLSVEGPAILIPYGGGGVRYFGITGSNYSETAASSEGDTNKDLGTSYFIKFDAGKSYHRGILPANLADRLKREDRDSRSLRYLSTGPSSADAKGDSASYYAEFDDGECWWATASSLSQENDTLHQTFLNMDVYRVAFGTDSWIVIGKDGDVVWKNLPQGLHDILASRDDSSAAACEVSLGMGGSYFIRFMDGSIEYSLHSFAADVCERLEAKRQSICNVSLNVATHDCLIRYSSEKTV